MTPGKPTQRHGASGSAQPGAAGGHIPFPRRSSRGAQTRHPTSSQGVSLGVQRGAQQGRAAPAALAPTFRCAGARCARASRRASSRAPRSGTTRARARSGRASMAPAGGRSALLDHRVRQSRPRDRDVRVEDRECPLRLAAWCRHARSPRSGRRGRLRSTGAPVTARRHGGRGVDGPRIAPGPEAPSVRKRGGPQGRQRSPACRGLRDGGLAGEADDEALQLLPADGLG